MVDSSQKLMLNCENSFMAEREDRRIAGYSQALRGLVFLSILFYLPYIQYSQFYQPNPRQQPLISHLLGGGNEALKLKGNQYFFFYKMSKAGEYVQYLQGLLKENHVAFKAEEEFSKLMTEEAAIEKISGGPLETNLKEPLTASLIQRYSRQMLLKQIGYEGQMKIVKAKVAVVGAGGIGCPLALYLAAAGVGTIGLFDSDKVDVTNLHRQVGHRTSTVGIEKTNSLKMTLLGINPFIKIKQHPFVTVQNTHLFDEYDLVIDGSDNPTCRYIVNDYCMKMNRKLLSGACIGWEAQITCYGGDSLCYRCLWGNDQVSMGGCSTLGVVGMLPGLVGMILATEALKLILQGESSLQGKLLTYNGKKCEFKKIQLRKKQVTCIGCGEFKLNMDDYDYAKYGVCAKTPVPEVPQITWKNYVENYDKRLILDVRPTNQYDIVHLMNTLNIPYENLSKLTKEEICESLNIKQKIEDEIPVSCARGVMSRHATNYLNNLGLKAVSIQGGILGYKSLYDSSIPQI